MIVLKSISCDFDEIEYILKIDSELYWACTAWSLIIRDSSESYLRVYYLTLADSLIRDSSDFNLRFYYLMSSSNHKTGVKSRRSLRLDLYSSLSVCWLYRTYENQVLH